MDVTGSIEHAVASSRVKHRFFQWATKWCYGNIEQGTEKPDVPGVVCLLQSLGCHLREYEKQIDSQDVKQNSMKIILECGSSKMRAVLELDEVHCQCTKPEMKEASYWSVSGTGPTGSCDSINKFEETGSNLLPPVSRDDRALIRDILHRLLDIVNPNNDVNHNLNTTINLSAGKSEGVTSPLTRSVTQPEFTRLREDLGHIFAPSQLGLMDKKLSMSVQSVRSISSLDKTLPLLEQSPRPKLSRQSTWDLDPKIDCEPRPSPPKISSSPVVLGDLCCSLGQVSLQSDEDNLSLAECLKRAEYYIKKAQNCYGKASPGPNDEKVFVKPLPLRARTSLGVGSRPSSVCSSPGNLGTNSVTIQRPIARRSVGTTLSPKPTGMLKTSPSKLPSRRKTLGSSLQGTTPTQRASNILKKLSSRTTSSTSSNSSLSSIESRGLLSIKRRVSPDPKSPIPPKSGLSQPKSLSTRSGTSESSPRPPGVNRSLSAIQGLSGARGLSPLTRTSNVSIEPGHSPRSASPGLLSRKSTIGISKFSLVKKEK